MYYTLLLYMLHVIQTNIPESETELNSSKVKTPLLMVKCRNYIVFMELSFNSKIPQLTWDTPTKRGQENCTWHSVDTKWPDSTVSNRSDKTGPHRGLCDRPSLPNPGQSLCSDWGRYLPILTGIASFWLAQGWWGRSGWKRWRWSRRNRWNRRVTWWQNISLLFYYI